MTIIKSKGQQKSPKCSTWMQSQKWQNDFCSFPRQTIQYHGNLSLCPDQQHQQNWSWTILWRPTRPFRTNTPKRCSFPYRGLECKTRKSRDTWSNRQTGIQNEAGQRPEEICQENTLVIKTLSANNTREDSIHGHHQMINTELILTIFFADKDGETLYSQQKPDQELSVAQIMNSLLPNSDLNWRK